MSELFNEDEANQTIITNLLKEIRRLTPMALYQLADGTVINAENVETVSVEALQAKKAELEQKLAEINTMLPKEAEATPEVAPTPEPAPAATLEATAEQPVPETPTPPTNQEPQPEPAPTTDQTAVTFQ